MPSHPAARVTTDMQEVQALGQNRKVAGQGTPRACAQFGDKEGREEYGFARKYAE
jgi:hypothetical protein